MILCNRITRPGVATFALLLTLCFTAPGQVEAEVVIRAPERVAAGSMFVVRTEGLDKDAKFHWHPVGGAPILADLLERETLAPVLLVQPDREGTLYLVLAYLVDGVPRQTSVAVLVGRAAPDPEPEPDPDPDPEPEPLPSGKRTLLIVRETADSTPAMRSLVTLLRTGEHAAYLTSKGHSVAILDDDSVDAGGNPSPVLDSWRPHYAAMTLPVVFVLDQGTGQIIHKQELAKDATAGDVMGILKEHGG